MAKVTKTKIGRVMLLNKGTYNSETAYSELDVVKESGRTYICLKNCKGIQPTNTEYWILAADIGISPTNKEDYNTEEEKSLYANELSDYGKIALDEYTAEKVEQLIAKEVELEGVLDTEKNKQIGIINDKTENYNTNAETETSAFNTNASDKTAAFDTNAETKTSAFNTNATEKTTTFNTNVSEKTSDFNANVESKTLDFNTNATEKTASFNQNASDKVAEFDDVKDDLLGQTDDLFDALTTNEASGTELYIDDAKACRVINSEIDGMYQQETTTGKNLLDVKTISVSLINHKLPETLEAGEYVFSCDNVNQEVGVRLSETTDTSSNSVVVRSSTVVDDRQILKIKTTFTSNYINISSLNVTLTNMMLEVGTTATDFEPYTGRNSITKSRLSTSD